MNNTFHEFFSDLFGTYKNSFLEYNPETIDIFNYLWLRYSQNVPHWAAYKDTIGMFEF